MSRFLYACGLCVVAAAFSLYVARIEESVTAWRLGVGFLAFAGFFFAVEWILGSPDKTEHADEEK